MYSNFLVSGFFQFCFFQTFSLNIPSIELMKQNNMSYQEWKDFWNETWEAGR